MAQFRAFIVGLSLFVAPFLLFMAVSSLAFFQTINAKTINQTMEEKGVYASLVPALISTAKYSGGQTQAGQIPLQEQWVTDVANKAFPPETIKSLSQTMINGTFNWLNGETKNPEFSVDLSQNKQLLANAVGEYVTSRSASLPICTNQQLLEIVASGDINIYTVPCRPAYISPSVAGATAKEQVLRDQNLIKDQTLSPETLKNTAGISPFDQLKGVKTFFSQQVLIMVLLVALALLAVALSIWLATDKIRALKKASILLIVSAGSILFFTFVLGFSAGKAGGLGLSDKLTSTVLLPTFEGLVEHAQRIYYFGAFSLAVLSITLFVIYRILKK